MKIREGGFTLVEVMVSLMVLAIALIALWGFHWRSANVNLDNRRQSDALLLASERLEEIRAAAAAGSLPAIGAVTETAERGGGVFNLETTVAQDATFPWRRNVTVTVQWTGKGNVPAAVALDSLVVELN